MCIAASKLIKTITGPSDAAIFDRFNVKPRRCFVERSAEVRTALASWLSSLEGPVPQGIQNMFFHCDWETFTFSSPVNLNVGYFVTALIFFEINGAPLSVRRMFWEWILDRPGFSEGSLVPADHPYFGPFQLAVNALKSGYFHRPCRELGGFYCVRTKSLKAASMWNSYNIWNARGVYLPDRGGARLIDTNIRLANDNHDVLDLNVLFDEPEMS